jgi:tetratricopeptide (TPR) repeat protein
VRRRTAVLIAGATAVALALGALLGGVLAEAPSAGSGPPVESRALAQRALSPAGASLSGSEVSRLEDAVRARPHDADALVQLGYAYQLRWRETGDASYLPRSGTALRDALRARPGDADAVLGLGSLALIRHEFRAALTYGRRARRLLLGSARPYGVIGDAEIELGRYRQAFAAFERMVSLRPSLASYARIAYSRELTGDREGAQAAMRQALEAAGGQPESTAWVLVEISKLDLALGRLRRAERLARVADEALPGYPSARVQLARVEAARGDDRAAIADATEAVDELPTQQAVSLLGDLLERAGRPAAARRQRELVAVIERLLRANGVQVDLEAAGYRADQRIRPRETVELARRAQAERPSIYGDDALGWALARAGRCGEALPWARRSLHLGTKDPLLYFHLGYAEGCAGNRVAMRDWYGRALELSPWFSVRWAPVARAALARS